MTNTVTEKTGEKAGVKEKKTPRNKVNIILGITCIVLLLIIAFIFLFPIRHYDSPYEGSPSVTYAVAYVAVDWEFDDAGSGVYPIPWHKLFTGEMPAEKDLKDTYFKLTDLELLWDTYELPRTGMTYQSKRDEHYHAHPELYM